MAIYDENKINETYKTLPRELYEKYDVQRGLRKNDGSGVMAGLTSIGDVKGYVFDDGEKVPCEGRLRYRGIDVRDIVENARKENRFAFEEVCYLLLTGDLPTEEQLENFCDLISENRALPIGFTEDMILKAPSGDVMNKLARSVLASYSYDNNPDDICFSNIFRQSVELIARMPVMAAYGYQAKAHYHDGKSLFLHAPQKGLSTAENFLYMIRPDNHYTKEEAEILDLALVLHAEHGGGNNSSFTTRVLSSSGTDTYSVIAAAIGSLKGPRHGGANVKVMAMMDDFKKNITDLRDDDQIKAHIEKILRGEAYDKTGLVYGMGHAIYTLSDPREKLLKEKARELSKITGMQDEFYLYDAIERYTPQLFDKIRHNGKTMCANVDMYSGLVYTMLKIPQELFTPLFAVSRISGWCAHRIEEITANKRIIRPAYKSVTKGREYIPMKDRA